LQRLPHRRAAHGGEASSGELAAQFVQRGVGLPGHAGRQLGAGRRIEQRGRTAAVGQGGQRTRRALAPTQFVHKRDGHAKMGRYVAHRMSTFGASRQYPRAQIVSIRFHHAKKRN